MKRILCLIMALFMIAAPICVLAAPQTASFDGEDLIVDGVKYSPEYLYVQDYLLMRELDMVEIDEDNFVYFDKKNAGIAFLDNGAYGYPSQPAMIYLSEKGREWYEDFVNGEFASYMITNSNVVRGGEIQPTFIPNIVTRDKVDVGLRRISNFDEYPVFKVDANGVIGRMCGSIYKLEDVAYYVDFEALDNSYFDSYGNLSFRGETVPAIRLTADESNKVSDILDEFDRLIYCNTAYEPVITRETSLAIFYVMGILLGVIVPLVPFVLGLIFASSKKALHPKRWYLLSLCAFVWIVIDVIILIMV